MTEYLFWTIFCILILVFVILDIGVFHRKNRQPTVKEAIFFSIFWVSLALLFNVAIFFIYEYGDFKGFLMTEKTGWDAALNFFTGYVIERSLSMDNLFVIFLIFSSYHIPLHLQHRVLTWGILSAAVLRGAFIILGTALVMAFSWILYIFGIILLITGLKLLFVKQKIAMRENNLVYRIASRFIPVTPRIEKNQFFIKEDGLWKATPLFLALLQIETADVMFALDSIPAIFAITLDPFIVFTSNIFAIFGLRAFYFVLAQLIDRIRFLEQTLAALLMFIGGKILISSTIHLPSWLSLTIVLGILGIGGLLSILFPKKDPSLQALPASNGENSENLLSQALKNARKVIVLVIGGTVLLIGIALLVLPGPAFVVIPLGLFILSTEFVWARRFLKKIQSYIQEEKNKEK